MFFAFWWPVQAEINIFMKNITVILFKYQIHCKSVIMNYDKTYEVTKTPQFIAQSIDCASRILITSFPCFSDGNNYALQSLARRPTDSVIMATIMPYSHSRESLHILILWRPTDSVIMKAYRFRYYEGLQILLLWRPTYSVIMKAHRFCYYEGLQILLLWRPTDSVIMKAYRFCYYESL